jgi:hypothetical protein
VIIMMNSPRRRAKSLFLAVLSAAVPVALAIALLAAAAATADPAAVGRAATVAAGLGPSAGHVTPSGTDASCPAATTAGAGSSTVGVAAGVRAIGGETSATVVWCPPAAGAAKVVSYTVTSSGGQTVTATVPNDWAIVDGLSNGTGYTFTVTANTSAGAAGVDYANYPTGSSGHEVYVFEQSVPLAAGKTEAAVTLPSLGSVVGYNAALHVFAMAIG